MCEATLYSRLSENITQMQKLRGSYFLVAKDIQLKMKLLDTRVITGAVYIERRKNLAKEHYEVKEESAEKLRFVKKQKTILGRELSGGIDFE